jgi:hypothetical protein
MNQRTLWGALVGLGSYGLLLRTHRSKRNHIRQARQGGTRFKEQMRVLERGTECSNSREPETLVAFVMPRDPRGDRGERNQETHPEALHLWFSGLPVSEGWDHFAVWTLLCGHCCVDIV